jgi:D-aminopeptidase
MIPAWQSEAPDPAAHVRYDGAMNTSGSILHTPLGKPRARAFGIDFDGETGPHNAITDVAGVSVGYVTLISGDGPLVVGRGPVRTGVTAILPRPKAELATPVYAGCSAPMVTAR